MSTTRFKICGVRTAEVVDVAVAAGASAIGLCFYPPSPRSITVDQAADLARRVPLWVERVALFVDEPPERVREVAARIGAGSVQLHGRITPEECAALRPLRVILGVAAEPGTTLAKVSSYLGAIDAVLLDAAVKGRHGGTGELADWDQAAAVREALPDLPLILAGGLRPENVGAAIRRVRPYAVDVASGVEAAPGVKDPELIRAFAAAVRRAGGEHGADVA